MRILLAYQDKEGLATVDWKANVPAVLDEIDKQLERFALEVVTVETGSDEYAWRIDWRIEKEARRA